MIRNPVDGEIKSKNADAYYYAPSEYGSVKLVSHDGFLKLRSNKYNSVEIVTPCAFILTLLSNRT